MDGGVSYMYIIIIVQSNPLRKKEKEKKWMGLTIRTNTIT